MSKPIWLQDLLMEMFMQRHYKKEASKTTITYLVIMAKTKMTDLTLWVLPGVKITNCSNYEYDRVYVMTIGMQRAWNNHNPK